MFITTTQKIPKFPEISKRIIRNTSESVSWHIGTVHFLLLRSTKTEQNSVQNRETQRKKRQRDFGGAQLKELIRSPRFPSKHSTGTEKDDWNNESLSHCTFGLLSVSITYNSPMVIMCWKTWKNWRNSRYDSLPSSTEKRYCSNFCWTPDGW